ncbi:MAG TPA: nucleoside 2-deoxyribosyltransferase [Thermomicrobiales bacterium]|nr:nucleoside 2-deoxyribosyltransferase [Thermomicrobiales bacterium]
MARKSIYLASPLGFADSTRGFMNELVTSLEAIVDVENPWDDLRFAGEFQAVQRIDSVKERRERLTRVNTEIGRCNVARIDASDGLFAILDGVDVDSGTAAEIGYAFAAGKYICGLRTDFRLAGDNEAAIVNLQVQYFIVASGGRVATSSPELVELAKVFSGSE